MFQALIDLAFLVLMTFRTNMRQNDGGEYCDVAECADSTFSAENE
jgi:hypothetical protein